VSAAAPRVPRLKVCCIANVAEAHLAVSAGATALGLVARMPSGPGTIDEATIAEIAAAVPRSVATFHLTSESDPDAIVARQRAVGTTVLQLVRHLEPAVHAAVRRALPGIEVVQVVHVEDEASVAYAERVAPGVDALLLDSGRPSAAIAELGGTGRVHDWALSARIRASVPVPVWLAGGLRSDNVRDAVTIVRPHGVDVCTGVRTAGALDPVKLAAFVRALHA
jgi:phosphoribosylanthranilate isomerase